jgi:hypothetical protein
MLLQQFSGPSHLIGRSLLWLFILKFLHRGGWGGRRGVVCMSEKCKVPGETARWSWKLVSGKRCKCAHTLFLFMPQFMHMYTVCACLHFYIAFPISQFGLNIQYIHYTIFRAFRLNPQQSQLNMYCL